MNQCINNIRHTFARPLLFNRNASEFVKMTLKITNYIADNNSIGNETVESMQLGRHSAASQNWPFSRQKFRVILIDKLIKIISSNFIKQHLETYGFILTTRQMQVF